MRDQKIRQTQRESTQIHLLIITHRNIPLLLYIYIYIYIYINSFTRHIYTTHAHKHTEVNNCFFLNVIVAHTLMSTHWHIYKENKCISSYINRHFELILYMQRLQPPPWTPTRPPILLVLSRRAKKLRGRINLILHFSLIVFLSLCQRHIFSKWANRSSSPNMFDYKITSH